tara:strand:- start:372 stop:554 length:183 start_codon:yes stop_codon:yes gene_type:complete
MKNIAWNAMNNGRYDFWTGGKINEEKGPTQPLVITRCKSDRTFDTSYIATGAKNSTATEL